MQLSQIEFSDGSGWVDVHAVPSHTMQFDFTRGAVIRFLISASVSSGTVHFSLVVVLVTMLLVSNSQASELPPPGPL